MKEKNDKKKTTILLFDSVCDCWCLETAAELDLFTLPSSLSAAAHAWLRHVIRRSVTTNNIKHGGVHPGEADRFVKLIFFLN